MPSKQIRSEILGRWIPRGWWSVRVGRWPSTADQTASFTSGSHAGLPRRWGAWRGTRRGPSSQRRRGRTTPGDRWATTRARSGARGTAGPDQGSGRNTLCLILSIQVDQCGSIYTYSAPPYIHDTNREPTGQGGRAAAEVHFAAACTAVQVVPDLHETP